MKPWPQSISPRKIITLRSSVIVPAKLRTQLLPTLRSRPMPAKSKPARFVGRIELRNTISCCESPKNLVTKRFTAVISAEVDQSYGDFRARHEATVWQRWNRVLLILLLLAVWLVIVSMFVPPYKKLKIGHAEIDKLQAQRDEQQVVLSRQTREVNLLKTDPAYLETIARDRLDLMKEGETIFRIEASQADKRKDSVRR